MRPLTSGDDAYNGRSRTTSFTDNATTPMPGPHQQPQMTYFLADEKTMEASMANSSASSSRNRDNLKRSNYGVESLDTTISQDSDDPDGSIGNIRNTWKKNISRNLTRKSKEDMLDTSSVSPKSSADVSRDLSPSEPRMRRPSKVMASQPLTPTFMESPLLGSSPSSPISRRNSETDFSMDDSASQAILSSGEDDNQMTSEVLEDSSTSQLVMPSIRMPSRRPFTDKGKNLGRLKILIAGDSGVGKTSLIKAIVQSCGDIVHVDPLSSTPLSLIESSRRKAKSKSRAGSTNPYTTSQITEVYASTRAYPHWWSDFDDGKLLRRRKSMGDSVLERNLCFVDTPGYGNGTSCMECITPVVQYVESQLEKSVLTAGINDGELINMLSGSGGSQVDVVFYVILNRVKPVDIEYLRRLSPLTNIIPLIAQSDNLSSDQLQSVKSHVLSELRMANIRPFLFGLSLDEAATTMRPSPPFAISTIAASDDMATMDASLLMSPDYIQPLVPTELSTLVEQIFEQDTISWLRHSAAKKCIQWHREAVSNSTQSQSVPRSMSLPSSRIFGPSSQISSSPIGAANSYALARITDHTQREERLAQVRLSKWATDLQRSLQNERLRFEALARGERAVWLTERLGECVQDGTLVPICDAKRPSISPGSGPLVKQGMYVRRSANGSSIDHQDPLGLTHLLDEVERKAWATLQVVGGFGIIGGLAFWIARGWNSDNDSLKWGLDWSRMMIDW